MVVETLVKYIECWKKGVLLKNILIFHPFLQLLGQEHSGGTLVFSACCHTKNSLQAPRGTFTLCLQAQSEPKGFTSAVATCYSAYGVENNIMQKYPRSFLLSVLPSSCCCAVFTPPDCRLLTLLRYSDSGMLILGALSSALPPGDNPALPRIWWGDLLCKAQAKAPQEYKHRLHWDTLSSLQSQAQYEKQSLLCFFGLHFTNFSKETGN